MRQLLPFLALAGCLAPQPLAYDAFEERHEGWVVLHLAGDDAQARVGEPPSFEVRSGALRLVVERNGTEPGGAFRLLDPAGAEERGETAVVVPQPAPGTWRVEPAAARLDLATYRVRILY